MEKGGMTITETSFENDTNVIGGYCFARKDNSSMYRRIFRTHFNSFTPRSLIFLAICLVLLIVRFIKGPRNLLLKLEEYILRFFSAIIYVMAPVLIFVLFIDFFEFRFDLFSWLIVLLPILLSFLFIISVMYHKKLKTKIILLAGYIYTIVCIYIIK